MIWGWGLGQRIRVEFFLPGQPGDEFFFLGQPADELRVVELSFFFWVSSR